MSVTPGDAPAPIARGDQGGKLKELGTSEATPRDGQEQAKVSPALQRALTDALPEPSAELLGLQAERPRMSVWRRGLIFDLLADLEREIVAMGFLHHEEAVRRLTCTTRFTTGAWERVAGRIALKVRAGGLIAHAIAEMDDEGKRLVADALRDHEDARKSDWGHLELVVGAQAALARLVEKHLHPRS